MIDIHSHILPSLDDGPKTIESSIEMCKIAANDGIRTIVATPHTKDGVYEAENEAIFSMVETLNQKLKEEQIDLKILPGSEIRVNEGLVENVRNGEALTLNDGKKFILLEFPFLFVPPGMDNLIFALRSLGIVTIIAHTERIDKFQKDLDAVSKLTRVGALVQITAQSLTGDFGPRERKCAEKLLKKKMVHFMATDAHSLKSRPPILSKGLERAVKFLGKEEAEALVYKNPLQIINGIDIN